MTTGNLAFDLADRRAEEERTAGVIRIRRAVNDEGALACVDCTRPIDDARRRAAPFATRCICCQRLHEQAARRRA